MFTYCEQFIGETIYNWCIFCKMDNEFLSDCLTIYIEKAVVKEFSLESIINDINVMKSVRHNF